MVPVIAKGFVSLVAAMSFLLAAIAPPLPAEPQVVVTEQVKTPDGTNVKGKVIVPGKPATEFDFEATVQQIAQKHNVKRFKISRDGTIEAEFETSVPVTPPKTPAAKKASDYLRGWLRNWLRDTP